jgi:hypothetical protein
VDQSVRGSCHYKQGLTEVISLVSGPKEVISLIIMIRKHKTTCLLSSTLFLLLAIPRVKEVPSSTSIHFLAIHRKESSACSRRTSGEVFQSRSCSTKILSVRSLLACVLYSKTEAQRVLFSTRSL